ncbi:MAG: YnbE family lipoprotein [Sphingomonadales bacterium]|nr:YnbE family lipoprotein [Sphingomonadales bacterium]MDE2568339.1 YnbE family lipoprotein [Sphingomonadales bacterium]
MGRQTHGRRILRASLAIGPVLGLVAGLGGCINVKTPDKPIVIELNINIKQEVVYRLAADAGNTIKDNPDIF